MEEKDIKIKKEETNSFKTGIKKKIAFAKLNKYFLFPFLAPIFCMMGNYCFDKVIYSKIKRVDFLFNINLELSYVTAGLLYFITKYRSRRKKDKIINDKDENSHNNVVKLIYNNSLNFNTKKILMFIILISLMNKDYFICFLSLYFLNIY